MVSQRKNGGDMYVPPPGMEMGPLAKKKLGWKEKWMDSRLSCETVEKGWSSADSPPMKKLLPKVNSAIKII
jgi:hypothetical protein